MNIGVTFNTVEVGATKRRLHRNLAIFSPTFEIILCNIGLKTKDTISV
jgi:hypothetical protein